MASTKKKTITAKKKTSKNTNKTVKKEALLKEQSRREIIGVVLVALGLLLGVMLYTDAVSTLGEAVKSLFFGMLGMGGFVLPVAVVVLGVVVIVKSKSEMRPAVFLLLLLGVLSILSIMHIITRPYNAQSGINVISYYGDAYTYGYIARLGGGIMGALLAYPAQVLVGEACSYIIFTAFILIVLLAVTKLSLRDTASRVKTSIKNHAETSRISHAEEYDYDEYADREMTTVTLGVQEDGGTRIIRQKKKSKNNKNSKSDDTFAIDLANKEDSKKKKNTASKKRMNGEDEQLLTIDFCKVDSENKKLRTREQENGFAVDIDDEKEAPKKKPMPKKEYSEEREEPVYQSSDCQNSYPEENAVDDVEDFDVTIYDPQSREAVEFESPVQDNVVPIRKNTRIDTEKVLSETEKEIENQEEYRYERPPFSLMKAPDRTKQPVSESPEERARLLERTFKSFNIDAKVTNVTVGPVITRFELQPAQGVRVNKITSLSNDIALALAASRVRIEAPIPGKAAIGIEVPNKATATVYLREVVENQEFLNAKSPISFALGKDIAGKIVFADLGKMPHLLIAGSTGSGKSVCINDIIISMAYKATPEDVRMILIDPKVVELKMFATMPHLLLPVVTDPKKAAGALKWAVMEMDRRYQKMSEVNARDLARYNTLVEKEERLPKIVVVIDELADLMMVAAKDVEESICRIAQLGRASGIHLIVATQRPSTDVITGLIKANIPSRIAFMVSSAIDSRVILDCSGAEKLLGKGDMLFHANGSNKPVRIQGAFIDDEEVESIMDFFGQNPMSKNEMLDELTVVSASAGEEGAMQGNGKQEDDLLGEAVKIVLDSGQASISMIQRRLRVGYARAARLIDIMEQKKIVSGFEGSKPRKLLIDYSDYERMFGGGTATSDGVEDEID